MPMDSASNASSIYDRVDVDSMKIGSSPNKNQYDVIGAPSTRYEDFSARLDSKNEYDATSAAFE